VCVCVCVCVRARVCVFSGEALTNETNCETNEGLEVATVCAVIFIIIIDLIAEAKPNCDFYE
jgi:hypothetical protein